MKNKKTIKVSNDVKRQQTILRNGKSRKSDITHLPKRHRRSNCKWQKSLCKFFSLWILCKKGGEVENSQYILQCQTYQNLNRKFVRLCQTQLQRERSILCKKQIDLGREMERRWLYKSWINIGLFRQ